MFPYAQADGTVLADYWYAYNLAGEVTQEASHGVATDYAYDLAGQVVAAARPASPGEAYAYDASGNAAGAGRAVGPMNRVAADAAFDYGYDDEGNLTSRVERATGEVTAFAYDHRDRLTGSERRSAGGVLLASSQSTYDVFDRLIVRTAGGVATATLYDGVNPWADAGGGVVTARYLYGDGADELLARWTPAGGQAWYLADKQGTVRDLIDSAGAVVGTRSYDAFGRIVAESGVVDRFAFQGREWDAGAALYQFRARWYDSVTRQFTSADPLGFAAGDWNTRRFVANNPLSGTDPTGTESLAGYSLSLNSGSRAGATVAGAILGFVCGYLDGWFDPNVAPADREAHATRTGIFGGFVGGALGYLLYPVTSLPLLAVGAIALLTVYNIGTAESSGQFYSRLGCALASFAGTALRPMVKVRLSGRMLGGPKPRGPLTAHAGGGGRAGSGGPRLAPRLVPGVQFPKLFPLTILLPALHGNPGGLLPFGLIGPLLRPVPMNMAAPQDEPGVPDPQPDVPANPGPNPPQNQGGGGGNGNDGVEAPDSGATPSFPTVPGDKVKPAVRDRLQDLEAGGAEKLHPKHDFSPYKNNTEPKLPAGGDYIEIYVTDMVGDSRRLIIDRTTGTVYYTPDHYKSWQIVTDPWMHGGPAGF